jgi:hypothetical protein
VLTCGELVYSVALSSEGCAIAAHRFNRVVVRRLGRKVHHRDAVDHVRQILIPPVKRFCLAIEVLGIRAVVHYRVLDQAAASICRPSDNDGFIRRHSSAGPLMICMRAAFLPAGRGWEAVWTEKIGMLTETAIANTKEETTGA